MRQLSKRFRLLNKFLTTGPFWIYGTCREKRARKHWWHGNVQFILWKAGEQGHTEDYWIDFDSSWWELFIPDKNDE